MKLTSDLHCSILVRSNYSIPEITEALKMKPTRSNLKGDRLSKLVHPLETNVWEFERVYRNITSADAALESFFSECPDLRENISKSGFKDDICVRLFIQSDYAQMATALSPKILCKLANIDVPIEVSIFSWGKV